MAALKECPFCGAYRLAIHKGPDRRMNIMDTWHPYVCWVECTVCGSSGPVGPSETAACKLWNGTLIKEDPEMRNRR